MCYECGLRGLLPVFCWRSQPPHVVSYRDTGVFGFLPETFVRTMNFENETTILKNNFNIIFLHKNIESLNWIYFSVHIGMLICEFLCDCCRYCFEMFYKKKSQTVLSLWDVCTYPYQISKQQTYIIVPTDLTQEFKLLVISWWKTKNFEHICSYEYLPRLRFSVIYFQNLMRYFEGV